MNATRHVEKNQEGYLLFNLTITCQKSGIIHEASNNNNNKSFILGWIPF